MVPSEVEDDEADFWLSNEMAQHLEKIEQEHPGGLLTPDSWRLVEELQVAPFFPLKVKVNQ